MKRRIHYAWFVLVGCSLLLFCGSGLSVNAFTVYQPFIMQKNGFTNAQTSGILTVRSLFSFAAMLLTGIYYKKCSLRFGMTAAGFAVCGAFLAFGFSRSLMGYYASAALMGIGYGLCTMIPISVVLAEWFRQKRTLAIGICSASTGISTLGIPSLLTRLIETLDLRATFLLEAAAVTVLVICSGLLIRSCPEDVHMAPYGEEGEETGKKQISGFAPIKPSDWVWLVAVMLMIGAVTSVGYSHLSVLMSAQQVPAQTVALNITVSGLALTGGKCVYGWMAEYMRVEKRTVLFGAVLTAGLVLLCVAGKSEAVLLCGSFLYGFGLSVTTVGITEWAQDFSTEGEYDRFIRRMNVLYAGGSFAFSTLPGILADRFDGSYVPAYALFALLSVVLIGIVEILYLKRRKNGH